MGNATRETILAASSRPRVIESTEAPGLGGTVHLRRLESVERDRWEDGWAKWRVQQNGNAEDSRYFHAYLLTWTLCDETGRRLFGEQDVRTLGAIPWIDLRPAARKALAVNGMGAESEEQVEKNSDCGQSDGSGSSSQEPGAAP